MLQALLLLALPSSARVLSTQLWEPAPLEASLPAVDLSPSLLPPDSQGERNTCSAFAAGTLGEHLWSQELGEPVRLSEQYLYYAAKQYHTRRPELKVYRSIDGLAGYVAVRALGSGMLPADALPYTPKPPAPKSVGVSRFTGRLPRDARSQVRRDRDFRPIKIERERIAEFVLREKKPVVFNVMWYFDAADALTGVLRAPTDAERRRCLERNEGCGGHVVALVGFDPGTREFLFRNSWGPGWGRGGFGRMPESYVLRDCEMCAHLPNLDRLDADTRRLVEEAGYGWSGTLVPARRKRR